MWLEVVLFVVLVVLLRYWFLRPKGMPPGPMVFPYLGSEPAFDHDKLRAYRKKYGDIFKTEIGPNRMIFLCNYELIKETFSKPELSDRPYMSFPNRISDGEVAGVIMTNGERWQNARRFLLRNLRDLGMGKTYLEDAIIHEANMVVENMKTLTGAPTPFPKCISIAGLNVVWQMIASKRYELGDEEIARFIDLIKATNFSNILMLLVEFIPWVKMLVPTFVLRKFCQEDIFEKTKSESKRIMREVVTEHRAKLDPDNPRDVVDQYLVAMDSKADIAEFFSETDLMRIIFDLFGAGFDTTSSMLRWTILYMIKYPDVQRRVQQQIDDVVPRDTLPSYQHKSRLSLVEATIHEVLRVSSLVAMGVQHANQTDMYLKGYFIPKGSWVFGLTLSCHEDPKYWEKPEQFNIDRFLDAEGNFAPQKEGFLPFGVGRRSCLGEALARMELYIFTAAILQNFSFSAPEGCEVDLEHDNKIPPIRQAKEQNIVITLRK
ncbi:cytochrome P450 2L1 [Procambarus clarkii]|uniref:cytochrome P450 2L1 n=1 Tax=Procambarus clarkii TaxID=6728 RepID=UPI001E6785DA|nr:cytochrome P450 2L1-like [Procambarus clarkii]